MAYETTEIKIRQYLERCLMWRGYKVGFYVSAEHFAAVKDIVKTYIKPDVIENFSFSDMRSNKQIIMTCTNKSEFHIYSEGTANEFKPNMVIFDDNLENESISKIMQTAENYTFITGKELEAKYLPLKIN